MGRSWVLLCWATIAFAEEKPPSPPPASPPEDTLETARRELEAIKSVRGGVEQPRPDLPRFSIPEAPGSSAAPPRLPPRLTPTDAAAAKKSANWLVDAMMKKPAPSVDGRDRRSSDGAEGTDLAEKGAAAGETNLEAKVTFGDATQRRGATKSGDPALNPLNGFMAGWMSAQDYKLLQPGMGQESSANLIARGESSSYLSAAPGGAAGGASLAGTGRTTTARPATPPRENPFLAAAPPSPAPVPPGLSGVIPPKPKTAVPPPKTTPPPPEPPPQKSATPDFVKPNDDAKYFKPLKRF
ncbi:MAG: hypothetical protein NTV51_29870 [Verrucomicrobia bacterium]|nr:hypothetical protein [Verrucomicrobiota bacterium]